MKIFLAAPIFSEAEREFNQRLAKKLRESYEVFLAQELGIIDSKDAKIKSELFKEDLKALKECDVVIAILDGVDVDSGVAFEIGYAYAIGKPIIGIKTDHRCFSPYEEVNLMIESSVKTLITCKDFHVLTQKLINLLNEYTKNYDNNK